MGVMTPVPNGHQTVWGFAGGVGGRGDMGAEAPRTGSCSSSCSSSISSSSCSSISSISISISRSGGCIVLP